MMYKQDAVLKVLNRFSPSSWKTQWLRHQYCNNLPDTVHSTCPGTFRTVQLGVFVYQLLGFCAFSFEQRFLNPPYSSPTFKTRFLVAWAHPKREVWTSKPHLTNTWTKLNKANDSGLFHCLYPLIPIGFPRLDAYENDLLISNLQITSWRAGTRSRHCSCGWTDEIQALAAKWSMNDVSCAVLSSALLCFLMFCMCFVCFVLFCYFSASCGGWTQKKMWVSISNESFTIRISTGFKLHMGVGVNMPQLSQPK